MKRSTLIRKFKEDKHDVIALQEIHTLSDRDENELKSKWGGVIHHSWGSNHSKGLITLFHPKFAEENVELIFKSDRIIISSIKLDGDCLFIIN